MTLQFWKERWDANRIGFHSPDIHPHLQAHLEALTRGAPSGVLVPLCGKSVDLAYLAERGHRPIGVEIVESAARQFFAESDIEPTESDTGNLILAGGGVTIVVADIFELTDATVAAVGPIDAVWDRAALVALPREVRVRYVPTLRALEPAAILLNAFDYDQRVMDGPPWSVDDAEVRELYAGTSIEVLERADVIDRVPFEGHAYWNSSTYLIAL